MTICISAKPVASGYSTMAFASLLPIAEQAGLPLDHGTFDLMTVFMPNMRGFEAIRLFHERAPTAPPVAISGSAFADMEIAAPEFLRLATRHVSSGQAFRGEAALMRCRVPQTAPFFGGGEATQLE